MHDLNILATDAYKKSMAQAGFPMRVETFYLSFRRGGWQYIPFDLEAKVQALLSHVQGKGDLDVAQRNKFLRRHDYGFTPAMVEAFNGRVTIKAAPAGTWVYEREPILTVTGPSFLVSWLEPMLLWLAFPIQFATQLQGMGPIGPEAGITDKMLVATCSEQADLMREVLEACGSAETAGMPRITTDAVMVDTSGYERAVRARVEQLIQAVGSADRLFEVGMRSVTCMEQHLIALQAAREAGLTMTSNVFAAEVLDLKPVGTMGHEHPQRWGEDLLAFRAMRDMRIGIPSYLLDTTDTVRSGIPAALQVGQEREHTFSIRYDSGDKYGQYVYADGVFSRAGLEPIHTLEDGFDLEMTQKFEQLREFTKVPPERQVYGYGGYIVAATMTNPLARDRVQAVYKLTDSCGPRMKFGDESGLGKQSVPGKPVSWRYTLSEGKPFSVIAQEGEPVPENYVLVQDAASLDKLKYFHPGNIKRHDELPYVLSPETEKLVSQFR